MNKLKKRKLSCFSEKQTRLSKKLKVVKKDLEAIKLSECQKYIELDKEVIQMLFNKNYNSGEKALEKSVNNEEMTERKFFMNVVYKYLVDSVKNNILFFNSFDSTKYPSFFMYKCSDCGQFYRCIGAKHFECYNKECKNILGYDIQYNKQSMLTLKIGNKFVSTVNIYSAYKSNGKS